MQVGCRAKNPYVPLLLALQQPHRLECLGMLLLASDGPWDCGVAFHAGNLGSKYIKKRFRTITMEIMRLGESLSLECDPEFRAPAAFLFLSSMGAFPDSRHSCVLFLSAVV